AGRPLLGTGSAQESRPQPLLSSRPLLSSDHPARVPGVPQPLAPVLPVPPASQRPEGHSRHPPRPARCPKQGEGHPVGTPTPEAWGRGSSSMEERVSAL